MMIGRIRQPHHFSRVLSMTVLLVSMVLLWIVSNRSFGQPPGGGMGGGFGSPPASGILPVLTKDVLQAQMTAHVPYTAFCANSQDYCTCCAAGGPCSTASSRASGMCGIAPDSNGAGGGSLQPVSLTSLAGGAASGGGGLMGSPGQSFTVNVSSHSLHVAKDYYMPPAGDSGSGCVTCSGGGGGDGGANGGSCLDFMMIRQNRGRDQTEQSSFGPGWFGSYDLKLHMNSDEVGDVDVFDPSDLAPRRFISSYSQSVYNTQTQQWEPTFVTNDGADGIWNREGHGVIKTLEMFTASGVHTGTRANASKAIVTNFDGVQFEFQVFLMEAIPGGAGSPPSGGGCGTEPQQSGTLHLATVRESTATDAESRLDIAERILRPKTLADIANSTSLQQLQARLLAGEQSLRGVPRSPHTVKGYMGCILGALNWANLQDWLPSPPKLRKIKTSKLKTMKGRPINKQEFIAMTEAAKEVVGEDAAESWKYVLRGLWESALRINELMSVSWDKPGTIRPRWKDGTLPVLAIPAAMQKNNTDDEIPLLPGFAALLLETPVESRTGWVFDPKSLQTKFGRRVRHQRPDSDWVGKVISRIGKAANIVVEAAVEKSGRRVKYASAHDLRRSCCEQMREAGVPPLIICRVMRHSSWETTRKHYAPGDVQRDAEVLDKILKPDPENPSKDS